MTAAEFRKAFHYIQTQQGRQAAKPRSLATPLKPTPHHAPLGRPANADHAPAAIVLDTNAALDGLLFDDAAMRPLMRQLRSGSLRWLVSPSMRVEFGQVLARPMLAKYVVDGERTLSAFDQLAMVCEEHSLNPTATLVCRDADDQVFIELALRERAPWLVTRDRDLLCLAKRAQRLNLSILTPADWERRFMAAARA
jgi:uncharacterized protein